MIGKRLLTLTNEPNAIPLRQGNIVTVTHYNNGRIRFKETGTYLWHLSDKSLRRGFRVLPEKPDNFNNLYLKLCGK